MKQLLKSHPLPALALLLALPFLLIAGCSDDDDDATAPPSEVQLDQSNDGETIEIASGGSLIIALPSNPTTGYAWTVSDPTGGLEQQGDPEYVPSGSTTPVVGAGGTEVFTFKVGDAGEYKLGLAYQRSFEPEAEPEDTFSITVTVR